MNRDEIFRIWAPPEGDWSPWVKPVLFAHLEAGMEVSNVPSPAPADDSWVPASDGRCAVVLDLPGAVGVMLGLNLARKGYRPVPLYNALPSPSGSISVAVPSVVCDVQPIVLALSAATPELMTLDLSADAPPVFLLDSMRRLGLGVRPMPGMFDNRSISLPTDFPSASRFLSMSIRRVILVQENATPPQEDLAHTLMRWQAAGISIELKALDQAGTRPIRVSKPPLYRVLWHRALALIGLRRNPLGGFGGTLPIPSAA